MSKTDKGLPVSLSHDINTKELKGQEDQAVKSLTCVLSSASGDQALDSPILSALSGIHKRKIILIN